MPLNQSLLNELEQEAISTKKMLERVPEEHFGWKPHEKSFSLGKLASHVAELTQWIPFVLTTDELDFAKGSYKGVEAKTSSELMQIFEINLSEARVALQNATDDMFQEKWKMRAGDRIFLELPKSAVIRSMTMNHLVHHRGQLSVYLRLLNLPVPGMYGPTADEPM